jgi:hypothetical protein
MVNCIQNDMRCSCEARTPKGKKYHPALKAVYERCGAKGIMTKVGHRCPSCGKFYPKEEE